MERLNEHELLIDTCNKTIVIKFSTHTRFWNNLHPILSKSKDWKAK